MANSLNTTTSGLNDIMMSTDDTIKQLDEDIEKLRLALQDIDKAKECFKRSADEMQQLEGELDLIFKGKSADAFMRKVKAYRKFCRKRISSLETLRNNYLKQINELDLQKKAAQRVTCSLNDQFAKLRSADIRCI